MFICNYLYSKIELIGFILIIILYLVIMFLFILTSLSAIDKLKKSIDKDDNKNGTIDKKEILFNRVYPAIRNCVGNRYKILTGIFSYYAFLISDLSKKFPKLKDCSWGVLIPLIFIFFVVHNYLNYLSNSKEQFFLENNGERKYYYFDMEFWFSIFSIFLTILGYIFIIVFKK